MLDGCVYAVGGWEGSYRLDSVERYDPSTNSWSLIEPMKMAVTSPAVIAHEGMLYVTGMQCSFVLSSLKSFIITFFHKQCSIKTSIVLHLRIIYTAYILLKSYYGIKLFN